MGKDWERKVSERNTERGVADLEFLDTWGWSCYGRRL